MAIPLEYFCKQLSELQKNDPDRFIRSLVALNDVRALEAISNVMYGNGGWGAKVIEWAAKTDLRAFYDGRWQRRLVLLAAEEAEARDDLSERERNQLSEDVEGFEFCLDHIINMSDDNRDKLAALGAIEHAFMIAGRSRISKETLDNITRERTAAANQARRAKGDAVQEIVNRHVQALWAKKPSFKGNKHGTATEIRPAVNAALQALHPKKIPKGWSPARESDSDSVKREIGRLSKRVGRISVSDK